MSISLSQVSKSFEEIPVIKNVTLDIPLGKICCLLGPSGSGKTTLIRLMIGAIHSDQGTIRFQDVTMPNKSLLTTIGFMPQNDALYTDLSAEANLIFFGRLYKIDKAQLKSRIDEVLLMVDLESHRKKLVANFSGGMKKRLSLAVALLHSPSFLFLDEPTVGIDPVLRRTIWNKFHEIKQSGTTIIISTHVMDEVLECEKAALLYDGSIIEYDDVTRLIEKTQNGRIEELFFNAATNLKVGDDK